MTRSGFSAVCLLVASLLGQVSVGASAEPKVPYVGLGRYTCSGSSAACAQVNSNNAQVEEAGRRRYQEGQDRAQRYVHETRRKEREYEWDRGAGGNSHQMLNDS